MNKQKRVNQKYSTSKMIDENTPGYESFLGTINFLKDNASKSNIVLSDIDIANKINITAEQFRSYYTSGRAPSEIFTLLKSQYKDFLPAGIEIIAYEFEVELEAPDTPDPMEDE